MPTAKPLTQTPAWKALEDHYAQIRDVHLRDLFAREPGRGERMAVEAVGMYLDYSKNRVTDETLATARWNWPTSRACASGPRPCSAAKDQRHRKPGRAARGPAAPRGATILVDGKNVVPEVHAVLDKMAGFADRSAAASGWAPPASGSAT